MTIILGNDQFGKNLRRIRLKKGMSQKALGEKCGISAYTIRFLESGRLREVEEGLLSDICAALGTPMEEFFSTEHPEAVE